MQNLKKNNKGQGMVEYIILVCLMGLVMLTIVGQMSRTTKTKFQAADSAISALPTN